MDQREQKKDKRKLSSLDAGGHTHGERQLRTGEPAAVSGIYQVFEHPHLAEGELFVQRGSVLPSCPICREPAQFRLVKKIVHITEDPDFK